MLKTAQTKEKEELIALAGVNYKMGQERTAAVYAKKAMNIADGQKQDSADAKDLLREITETKKK